MESEDRALTQCLQNIDNNFASSVQTASQLLHNVKLFEKQMGKISSSVRVWSTFFDSLVQQENQKQIKVPQVKDTEQDAIMEFSPVNDFSNTSSFENPPTPCMPAFSKSFAKTPMGRALLETSEISTVTPVTPDTPDSERTPHLLFHSIRGSSDEELLEFQDIPKEKPQTVIKSAMKKHGTPLSYSVASKRTKKDIVVSDDIESELLLNQMADDDVPAPEFSLSMFPKMFQNGQGAAQVTSVYSCFGDSAYSVEQLMDMLPKFGRDRLELMLEMLVSRGLIRPFTIDETLKWRLA